MDPRAPSPSGGDPRWLFAAGGRELACHDVANPAAPVPRGVLRLPEGAQYACFSPRGDRLYVACSDGGIGRPGQRHCLVAVKIDGPDALHVETVRPLPHRPIHIALDGDAGRLHLAFNRRAAYMCIGVDEEGVLQQSDGPHAEGEEALGFFPHQVLPMPGTPDVLVTSRGDDPAAERPENPGSLKLLRVDAAGVELLQAIAPEGGYGFGPRNCALHPQGPWLYAVLERQNALALFRKRDTRLEEVPAYVVPTLSEPAGQMAGDLGIHPGGRFLYVLNRARSRDRSDAPPGENSIATFSLDPLTGEPAWIGSVPLPGQHPRALGIAASGRLAAVAVMKPGEGAAAREPAGVCLLAIDPATGQLALASRIAVAESGVPLMWAAFSPAPLREVAARR